MIAQLEIRPPELESDQAKFDFERDYTLEEFFTLDLPEYDEDGDEVDYELWQGKIVAKKSGTSARHAAVILRR
jgi:hypothetical protein